MSERHAQGMKTRRKVLGDAHVDRAMANRAALDAPFQDLITEAAWGHVWSRDAISPRDRSPSLPRSLRESPLHPPRYKP